METEELITVMENREMVVADVQESRWRWNQTTQGDNFIITEELFPFGPESAKPNQDREQGWASGCSRPNCRCESPVKTQVERNRT